MNQVAKMIDTGKKSRRQISGLEYPVTLCCREMILGIFLLLMLSPTVDVTTAIAHSGMDPEIDKITHELEENPENVELLLKRGRLYRSNGKFSDSLQDLDLAEELDPDNREITFQRGFTLSALGRDNEAEVALDQYLEKASGGKHLTALVERAHIRARTGQAALAINDFNSAISRHPVMALYLARSELYESLGHLEEAASGYREGLSRVGNATLLKKGLIRVETTRKRYDEVLRLIDEELDRASVKTEWHMRRAEVLSSMGKDQAAQSAHQEALAEANRVLGKRVTATHLVARAKVYLAMGQLEKGKHELRLAVQRAPRFAEARDMLKKLEKDRPPEQTSEVPMQQQINHNLNQLVLGILTISCAILMLMISVHPAAAEIVSPSPSSTLMTPTVIFQWEVVSSASQYYLGVGTSPSSVANVPWGDIFAKNTGTNISQSVSGIPITGNPVYVRLWWRIGTEWFFTDYTYQTQAVEVRLRSYGNLTFS